MGHVIGQSREQATLFPERLDEVIALDHPVRVIDAFVDSLDLSALGFGKVEAAATGRPPYEPGDLLKLYVYGYLNRVRSSRGLMREARRNVEVMWLIGRLAPVFKTIADFRKDHAQAIVGVCRSFIGLCRGQGLYGAELVAIDGTKIEAVASRKRVVTPERLAKLTAALDEKIAGYLAAMDEADAGEVKAPEEGAGVDVAKALAELKSRREELQEKAKAMAEKGVCQEVESEPEARLMRTAKTGYQVAYNAQTAVDEKHKLIVAFDLVNEGNDLNQLFAMAKRAKEELAVASLTVAADTGYSNGEEGELCAHEGIVAVVPRPRTVNPEGEALFSRERFVYEAASDSWLCPAGARLERKRLQPSQRKSEYWNRAACQACALKPKCTKAAKRVIVRDFFEDAREAMHRRTKEDGGWLKRRRCVVEHPFGGIKWLMGLPRFLVRGLKKAKSELALSILCYNLKRTIAILGVPALLDALKPKPC